MPHHENTTNERCSDKQTEDVQAKTCAHGASGCLQKEGLCPVACSVSLRLRLEMALSHFCPKKPTEFCFCLCTESI